MIFLLAMEVRAQAPAGDDLELPASGTPAPSSAPATAAPSPVAPAPASSTAPAAPTPAPSPADAELSELRRRVEALEAAKPTSEPKSAGESGASAKRPVVERPPSSRVVPLGFRIGGFVQAQYEHNQRSEDQLQQGGDPLNQDRFVVRRGRVRLDQGYQYALASLELDANTVRGPTVTVRRAEATVLYRQKDDPEGIPLAAATLGVMDIPFGYELGVEGSRARAFMERSSGTLALFPTEADLGFKVWGGVSYLRYAVALMNGEPLDSRGFPRDPNAAKDVVGRVGVDVTPIELLSVFGGVSFASGKGFHPGGEATKDSFAWSDTDLNGAVTPDELIPIPGSAASPSENFERWALGLDLGVTLHTKFGSTKLYGEGFVASNYDRGYMPADPVTTGIDIRETGVYGALVQDVTKYGLAGFRVAYYDPNADVSEQHAGEFVPYDQTVVTLSPLVGLQLRNQAKLLFQYDFVSDHLGRDTRGIPVDAENDGFTVRLQVEL
jgi:hypothetical protein